MALTRLDRLRSERFRIIVTCWSLAEAEPSSLLSIEWPKVTQGTEPKGLHPEGALLVFQRNATLGTADGLLEPDYANITSPSTLCFFPRASDFWLFGVFLYPNY